MALLDKIKPEGTKDSDIIAEVEEAINGKDWKRNKLQYYYSDGLFLDRIKYDYNVLDGRNLMGGLFFEEPCLRETAGQ